MLHGHLYPKQRRYGKNGENRRTAEKNGSDENLKFDIQKNTTPIDFNKGFDEGKGRILIAGSTHKGEDEIVLKTFKNLKSACSDLKLIIAPRHLTRVDSVSALIKETGFKFGLRSIKRKFQRKRHSAFGYTWRTFKNVFRCRHCFYRRKLQQYGRTQPA